MNRKLFVTICLLASPIIVNADDFTTQLMLMNNYNLRQNADIWSRMRQGFRLNHPQSKAVQYYEKLYTKNPKTFATMINNARPYIYYILTQTEREGMPAEIALLPGVESLFNPNAKSSSNAYGIWQFVSSTGRRYNLAQNANIDERQDIVKSTNAALVYLNYLHRIFGQWEPAIGAYNWGEGNMYKEILSSGQTPGNVDYYNLSLREETQAYLPKLIALASIIENPSKFGVNLNEVDNKPFFAIVNPDSSTSVHDLTTQAEIDKATFTKLNPQYKSGDYMISPTDSVLLPLSNQSIYYASIGRSINALPQPSSTQDNNEDNDQIMLLANGDDNNLPPVASTTINDSQATGNTGTNSTATTQENNANPTVSQEDGLDHLVASLDNSSTPVSSTAVTPTVDSSIENEGEINYTVAPGDTLYSIAKRFKADANQIRQENKIPGNNLTAGQTIIIKSNTLQTNG